MNNRKNRMIILLITLLAIKPVSIYAFGTGGGYNTGSGGAGTMYSTTDGVWNQNIPPTYLVTLIDDNGNKVSGTNSVYYKHDLSYNAFTSDGSNDCQYKYTNATSNCRAYRINLTGLTYTSGVTWPQQLQSVSDELQTNIKDRKKIYKMSGNEKFDFITSFLYHSGFLNDSEGYYDIDDSHWNSKRSEIAKNKYYILIEPIFSFNHYGWGSFYGTAKQAAQHFISTGSVSWTFSGTFTYALGHSVYTTATKAREMDFKKNTQGYFNMIESGAGNSYIKQEWNAIASPDYGNGIGIISIFDKITTIEEKEIRIEKENCALEGEERSNGIIYFNVEFDQSTFENAVAAGVEFEKSVSEGEISCYDNVTYDFSNIINSLNNTREGFSAKVHSYVDIPTGTVKIERYCRLTTTANSFDIKKQFAENFDSYNKLKIPLNAFGTTVNLEKISDKRVSDENRIDDFKVGNIIVSKSGIYKVTNEITFGYKDNNSKIYIKSNPTVKDTENIDSYIDFSGVTYGYSTKLLNNATDGKTYNLDSEKIVFKMNVNSSAGVKKCEFKTSITGDAMEKVKFRTISLDNPFPARDASTRLPGSNWLGEDNYVNTYINHNRGVLGNEVYNKEPIYTITLTPSQMIKIREYNKKHSYGDIALNCVGENNTSCFSNFLRTVIDSGNITGACSKVNSGNIKKDPNKISEKPLDSLKDYVDSVYASNGSINPLTTLDEPNSMKEYDFNNDGILSLRDGYIYDYADKTTNYYTCADKTFENSGYMRKVGR